MKMKRLVLISYVVIAASAILQGCSDTAFIQPVSSSHSKFEGSVHAGDSTLIQAGTPGNPELRVFSQGATAFVSIQSVRAISEERGAAFCHRKSKVMSPLRETAASPPFTSSNLPRVEIIFECVDRPAASPTLAASPAPVANRVPDISGAPAAPGDDCSKYTKLISLKKLLDAGILTQQEFDREKAKILSEH
jgi:putative oligomerization/nucleic acid binding protein